MPVPSRKGKKNANGRSTKSRDKTSSQKGRLSSQEIILVKLYEICLQKPGFVLRLKIERWASTSQNLNEIPHSKHAEGRRYLFAKKKG